MKMIPLTQGEQAIIDDDMYEYLSQWKWQVIPGTHTLYAQRRPSITLDRKRKPIKMHRVIMDAPSGMQVDHINGNGLDNRRANLRLCSVSQNQINRGVSSRNTTGYKGVSLTKQGYRAKIVVNREHIILGIFDNPVTAAHAYDAAAKKYHGSFAWLNFPD